MSVQRPNLIRFLAVVGALAAGAIFTSPASAVVLFSDNFESYAPNADVFGGSSPWQGFDTDNGIAKVRTDTGAIFGPGNQYLEYFDNNRNAADTGDLSDNPHFGTPLVGTTGFAVRMSFDFFEPADTVPAVNGYTRFTLSSDTSGPSGGANRSVELQLGQGNILQSSGRGADGGYTAANAYALGTTNHIDVIANYGTSNYSYSIGNVVNGTVAPQRLDILLNGNLVSSTEHGLADDLFFRNFATEIRDSVELFEMYSNNDGITRIFVDNLEISSSAPFATVNRATGNITFTNTSGSAIEDIVGYSITSAAGTLNSTEAVWNAISDTNPNWVELSGPGGEDLSELEVGPAFGGITVANNGTLNFGNVWHKHYTEDIAFELLIDDGTPEGQVLPVFVSYTGGSGPFAEGDLNFDGSINEQDAVHFGNHLYTTLSGTSPGATYAFGDMNGDLVSDYNDLVAFRSIYDAANGAGAFAALSVAAVPEPSSMLLLGVIGSIGLVIGRRTRVRCLKCCVAVVASVALLPSAQADIVFQESFNSIPAGTLLNNTALSGFSTATVNVESPHDASVLADTGNLFGAGASNNYLRYLDGADSGAPRLTGPANLSNTNAFQLSFDFHDPANAAGVEQVTRIGLSDADGNNAATTLDFQFQESLLTFRGTGPGGSLGDHAVNYNTGQTYSVVAVGNYGPSPIVYGNDQWIAPGTFDVWFDGQRVADNVPMPPGRDRTTHLSIKSNNAPMGETLFDNIVVHDTIDAFTFQEAVLTLQVNTVTGQMSIRNNHDLGFDLGLDFYRVTGGAGAFDLSGWNSLDDQEGADSADSGWIAAGSSNAQMLTEFTLDDSQASVAFGSPLSLGAAYNEASGAMGSLVFEYALDNGELVTGLVDYVTSTALAGDFNLDGFVDAADYVLWRNNLNGNESVLGGNGNGNGVVDVADYTLWKDNYGKTAGGALTAVATQVPEPSHMLPLLALGGVMFYAIRKRSFAMIPVRSATLLAALLVVSSPALAVTMLDRHYTMGDYDDGMHFEGASAANGPDNGPVQASPAGADVLDSSDPYSDLLQSGNPRYATVASGTYARAGATGFGIRFDGVDDVLSGIPVNALSETATQGMQMWVWVDSTGLGTGRQAIVSDTSNAGGPAISASGMWTQNFSNHPNDSDITPTVPVVGNTWHHVAQHIYRHADANAPDVVSGSAADYTSVLYVNGVAVSASNDGVVTPTYDELLVGAEGTTRTNFFKGVIDDLKIYTSAADAFDLFTDNDWIANRIAQIPGGALKEGDINFDGVIDSGDVTAFVAGWRKEKVLDGAHADVYVGDWQTLGWGDLNLDGRVDLRDAMRLHNALQGAGAGGLNFALLDGAASVPEPATVALLGGLALAGAVALKRRRA